MVKHTRKSKRRVLRAVKYQTGRSTKRIDRKRKAMRPGKRRSARGHVYYETRKNRSDKNRKVRL